MDGSQTGQNNNQGGNKKTQLSWSQPVTTPTSSPASKNETPKMTPPMTQSMPAAQTNNTFRNTVIVVVLLAAIGIVWMTVSSNKQTPTTSTPGMAGTATTTQTTSMSGGTVVTTADGAVSIPTPQTAGLEIAVSNVHVSVPTWVVIYENYNGQPGNVLGAGLFTSDRTSGVVDLLRGTLPGQTYFAGESRDDGDHMYSMDNDPPVRDANGNPIWVKFQTK